jgi:hypothetical protein
MADKALQPIEQKEVDFYGDDLTAVRADDGRVYVVMAHLCDALGIDTQGQARRVRRHTILANGLTWVDVLSTQGDQAQRRRVQVLRVDLVPLWLSGIRTSVVSEAIRPKLERFQQEAAAVLWEAFQEGRLTADSTFDELLETADNELVQAYQMAQAIVQLARNQIILSSRLDSHDAMLTDYGRRLETIEADLHHEERYISENEATQISQAVRAIAFEISKTTGKNEFGRCWGEFYRKFGVSKYRHLPVARFDEAMAWLASWYQEVTAGDVPF